MATNSWDAIFEARSKLIAYIDALWSGQAKAPDSLKDIYTERLAIAAKLASHLQYLSSTEAIRTLVREENSKFTRELLATDDGRQARSAFNLFARDATALEDYRAPNGSVSTCPDSLLGEELSSVAFVMDYIQLDFNCQNFQVFCPIVISAPDSNIGREDPGFRDRLCEAIGQTVRSVVSNDKAVTLAFDHFKIELIFSSDEANSTEPLVFTNRDRVQIYLPRQN